MGAMMEDDLGPAAGLPLLTAEQMRRWDREAIAERGIPERVLMESAGRAAAAVVQRLYPVGRVVAAVGRGNNGGDAVVMLRTLRAWGREVAAVPVVGVELPAALLHGWEVPVVEGGAAEAFRDAAVIVDGILGTGATGAPREPQALLVRAIAASRRPILALDGPTGVDLTTGAVAGDAVTADVTVTFGAPKRGLLLHPGRGHAGRILVVETGFPPLIPNDAGVAVITSAWVDARWRRLPANAHKGTAGRVVVLAGSRAMGGAAILCGHAAARTGAGTVRIISPGENRTAIQTTLPEALFVDREEDVLEEVAASAAAVVAGPGMGTDDAARRALVRMLGSGTAPVLLDADALTLLATDPDLLPEARRQQSILTPHPGEMGRLLQMDTVDVTADPFGAAEAARDRYRCTVLLKGAPTLVAAPGRPTLVSTTGHSGVGVGGMGDTLAGIVGALLARGIAPYEAAGLGIHFAGLAADAAGRGRPILPRDVAEAIPRVLGAGGNETCEPGVVWELGRAE